MQFAPFMLGEWFDEHFFDVDFIIGESGVQPFSFKEIREITGITLQDLDEIVLTDSPFHGTTGLREAIANRWRGGDWQQVMTTHGSSEAMFLVMSALLKPEDEVVVLTPCYQPLFSIPEALNCTVKQWKLRPEKQFKPDLEDLRQLLTPNTRMVVVNFPNNPTGATITPEEQQRLVEMVAERNAYLLWDSAFVDLSYDVAPLPDPWTSYEHVITIGTLTKAYGLSGMRIGWCLAKPDILLRCVRIREYTNLNLSPLNQYIAQKVVEHLDDLLSRRLLQARENLQTLDVWITAHSNLVEWVRPQGGVSAFVKIKGMDDTTDFCRALAEDQHVFLLPGMCFDYPSYLRIGFGGSSVHLQGGLARLAHFLSHQQSSVNLV
jgi:capreomycidine synthase